jgi:hypothetical protein
MSEYQYVAFRAIDGPVSEKNLAFMRRQSSRAEITPWSFDNEYNFGDFRGDPAEMLRRGYDFHLHYANFGIHKLMIRLPHGLPDPRAAEPYFVEGALYFLKDQKGPGGILGIEPYLEPGDQEDLWEIEAFPDRLLPLRAELLDGDLRPLYLAHLAIGGSEDEESEEAKEGPVPAGLDQLTDAQQALAEFYDLSEALIVAAARNSPTMPHRQDSAKQYMAWLECQPEATRNAWLAQLMADPQANVRREVLAAYQSSQAAPSWTTICPNRSLAELKAAAEEIERDTNQRKAEKAARERAKKLADMAADPSPILRETEKLAKQRTLDAYAQVGDLLADLRNALAGSEQADLPEKQARKLREKHPTFKLLISELRKKGFLKT